ncbi:MAG: helix-hairpin-helix domain-containing protein [Myxococcales bacterium]
MSRALARVLVALFLALPAGSAAAEPASPAVGAALEGGAEPRRPIDLNRATEAELLELPGVGPSRAKAILAFRESHGGFQSVSQLLRIKGFGRAMFKRLRPLLVVTVPGP